MTSPLDKIRQQRNKGGIASPPETKAGALTKASGSATPALHSRPPSASDLDEIRNRTAAPIPAEERAARLEAIHAKYAGYAESEPEKTQGRVAILLDATASMENLLDATRAALTSIFREAKERAGSKRLQIQIFVFRQYGDGEVMASSSLTDDVAALTDYLGKVRAWGGDGLSAIELPLQQIVDSRGFDAVILAGDVRSHTADEVRRKAASGTRPCADLARQLGRDGTPLYTFVVPTTDADYTGATIRDFRLLAELAKGRSAVLDGSRAVLDMAVAVVLKHLGGRRRSMIT